MDGFDDLLPPSKRALEDNPFENPFAQHRSGSPDPWASFSSQLDHNPFSTSEPTTPISAFEPEPTSPVSTTSADPLDSHNPSPPRTPTQPTTSEFKEETLEDEHQLTPEPLSKPTPEFGAKSTPGPEPTVPQPEAERTPIQETTPLPPPTEPVSPSSSKGFVAFTPTHPPRESEAFLSPLDHPGLGGFGDAFPSIPSLGGGALGGGWESQSSSVFINSASLDSSREPSLPDDDDEDNRPVAQSPILKAKEKEKEALSNVKLIPFSPLFISLIRVQALGNPPLDKNTGLQPVFSITVDDPQKVGSPIGAYTMYTVHTRVRASFHSEAFNMLMSLRRLPHCTVDQPSPSSAVTRIFCGSTKHFPQTTRGSLSLQYRRKILSVDSTITSYNNEDWLSKGVYTRWPIIQSCKRTQI